MIVENVRDVKPYAAHDKLICRALLKFELKEFHGLWHGILKPGAHTAEHEHPYEEFYYIISGSGLMTVDDDSGDVKSLDVVFIPGWAKHGLKNNSKDDIEYICAAAPPTEESEDIFSKKEGFKPDPEYEKMMDDGLVDTDIK